MIPYVEWRTIELGPLTLQVWGLFAAIGVIAAVFYASWDAKRKGLDSAKIESLALWTIVAAFVGARLFHIIFYQPAHYLAFPAEILQVWKGGLSSFGGFFGAAAVAAWRIRKTGLPFLKTSDVAVPATVLGLGCGRIGCFLIHDHPGTLAHGAGEWFAVRYPDGARYDLGLLLGAVDFILFAALILLMRRPRPDGFALAVFLMAYAPIRFGLDFLRTVDVRYAGLTPGQYGSIALFGACIMVVRAMRRGQPVTSRP